MVEIMETIPEEVGGNVCTSILKAFLQHFHKRL